MTRFVVTGTDTGIGKTVFSAALAGALGLPYWKPIQSGLEEETDSEAVARLAGVPIHPETWRLVTPASPHLAAEIDGVTIDADALVPPPGDLLIEGAGGALVPVTRTRCTGCGKTLIVRDWYEILSYRLDAQGRCPDCGTPLAGRFGAVGAARGEAFGAQRIPVAIHRR